MQRFGILAPDLGANAVIDVYATDQKYWRSLWWRPTGYEAYSRSIR
jgi:hypothetical protein